MGFQSILRGVGDWQNGLNARGKEKIKNPRLARQYLQGQGIEFVALGIGEVFEV